MTAHMLHREVSRLLGGRCSQYGGRVRTKSGNLVPDCSGCREHCGDTKDMGLAAAGVRLSQDWRGLWLSWACPLCAVEVLEATELFDSSAHAERLLLDPLCSRCRLTTLTASAA